MMKFNYFIATFFYSGYFPKAPGTAGSITALPFLYAINKFWGFRGLVVFFVLTVILGFFTADFVAKKEQNKDPSIVVIDEVAGLTLAVLISYGKPYYLLLSFVLFRFFDILKPLFIKKLEKIGSAGTGIMLDDLLAGVYAGLAVLLAYKVI
jgi:phosphatidylglycerophosphatase A